MNPPELPSHVVANLLAIATMTHDAQLILLGNMEPAVRAAISTMFEHFHGLAAASLPPAQEIPDEACYLASLAIESSTARLQQIAVQFGCTP